MATRKRSELVSEYPDVWARRTGRSLGGALKAIGEALENPGTDVPLVDHASFRGPRVTEVALVPQVHKAIGALGLKGLTVKRSPEGRFSLQYKIPDEIWD